MICAKAWRVYEAIHDITKAGGRSDTAHMGGEQNRGWVKNDRPICLDPSPNACCRKTPPGSTTMTLSSHKASPRRARRIAAMTPPTHSRKNSGVARPICPPAILHKIARRAMAPILRPAALFQKARPVMLRIPEKNGRNEEISLSAPPATHLKGRFSGREKPPYPAGKSRKCGRIFAIKTQPESRADKEPPCGRCVT